MMLSDNETSKFSFFGSILQAPDAWCHTLVYETLEYVPGTI